MPCGGLKTTPSPYFTIVQTISSFIFLIYFYFLFLFFYYYFLTDYFENQISLKPVQRGVCSLVHFIAVYEEA